MPLFYHVVFITYTKLEPLHVYLPDISQHLQLTRETPCRTWIRAHRGERFRTHTFVIAQQYQKTLCLRRSSRRILSRHLDTLFSSWILVDPRGSSAQFLAFRSRTSRFFLVPSASPYPRKLPPVFPRRSYFRPAATAISRLRRDASHKRGRPAFERARRRGCVRPIRGSSSCFEDGKRAGRRARGSGLRAAQGAEHRQGVEERVLPSHGQRAN